MTTPQDWCPSDSSSAAPEDTTQLAGDWIADAIRNFGMQPWLLTGVLRNHFINHFASELSIEQKDLRHLLWRDAPETGILIESTHRWTPEMTDKRPGLLISRNTFRQLKLTIGSKSVLDRRGFQHYTCLKVGSHTVFCVAKSGTACEILAAEVDRELTQFGPEISRRLRLKRFQVLEVGPVSLLEEAQQHFAVSVTVASAHEESWRLEEHSRPTRDFNVRILSQF